MLMRVFIGNALLLLLFGPLSYSIIGLVVKFPLAMREPRVR